MKTLVVYFSAEFGITREVAAKLAKAIDADLFEIEPEAPYTKADLKYTNPFARCNKEKLGRKDVPVKGYPADFENYDRVLIGFPIWYACAPNVVNTFCKGLDFTGKTVAAFATSGGSGIGRSAEKLTPYTKGAKVVTAKLFNNATEDELKAWADGIG